MKTQWLGTFLLLLLAALVSGTAYAENWKLWPTDDNTHVYIDLDSIPNLGPRFYTASVHTIPFRSRE